MNTFTFTFKRGRLRRAETWTIGGGQLVSGDGTAIELARAVSASFSSVSTGSMVVTELAVVTGSQRVKLQCNDGPMGGDRRAFVGLSRAVMVALSELQPTLPVTSPGLNVMNWGFRIIGGSLAAWGVYFAVAAALEGGTGTGFGIGMGVFFVLLGVFAVWCTAPFSRAVPKTPAETVLWIDRLGVSSR